VAVSGVGQHSCENGVPQAWRAPPAFAPGIETRSGKEDISPFGKGIFRPAWPCVAQLPGETGVKCQGPRNARAWPGLPCRKSSAAIQLLPACIGNP